MQQDCSIPSQPSSESGIGTTWSLQTAGSDRTELMADSSRDCQPWRPGMLSRLPMFPRGWAPKLEATGQRPP